MFYALILFCAVGVSPADCQEVRAAHYERVPGGHALPNACFREAQVWAAEHGIAAAPGEYPKVQCSKTHFGAPFG